MTERSIPSSFFFSALVAALLLGTVPLSQAEAGSLDELRERFQQRYPQLVQAKREHTIGETWQGTVAVVPDAEADEDLQQLIEQENRDRQQLYRIIAEREETTADLVARRNAERLFDRAEEGHYLRDREGNWFQKTADEDD